MAATPSQLVQLARGSILKRRTTIAVTEKSEKVKLAASSAAGGVGHNETTRGPQVESLFPFTMVRFWAHIDDPQPFTLTS